VAALLQIGWLDPILGVASSFGMSGEIVVWDQGAEGWVGEEGDSPYPLGIFPPDMPLD
jgi:hypothetical protein